MCEQAASNNNDNTFHIWQTKRPLISLTAHDDDNQVMHAVGMILCKYDPYTTSSNAHYLIIVDHTGLEMSFKC